MVLTQRCLAKLATLNAPVGSSLQQAGVLFGVADQARIIAQDLAPMEKEALFAATEALNKFERLELTWLDVIGWFVFLPLNESELTAPEMAFHLRHFPCAGVALLVSRLEAGNLSVKVISAMPGAPFSRASQLRAFATADGRQPKSIVLRLLPAVTDESYSHSYRIVESFDRQERWQEWKDRAGAFFRWRTVVVLGASVAVMLTLAFLMLREHSISSTRLQVEQANVPMHVEALGDALMVTWDKNAPAVLAARRGVLHVEDGTDRQDIPLDAKQVANGVVLYRPHSAPANFQLELVDEGGRRWVTNAIAAK